MHIAYGTQNQLEPREQEYQQHQQHHQAIRFAGPPFAIAQGEEARKRTHYDISAK